ncbi:helix-turn-helix domain-containing protein [Streptomyces zagrosensis]|uniref:Transcriptional regulator with XRE-family HTH domain n=1 Tax=Streptomyces zagrosensis TaxID=1042984 RepID=A0A7W9Q5N2_9ACTN|nr:helix-turn-helix transcriptional regulator [Streptomyces zagrosensis]MBB5933985.1 transcriptional regulator with XRE-family HTH domain [Streptomyces zagrosensis]
MAATQKEAPEPQDAVAYFGSEVRHAREHAGMTQAQLAKEARYERPYVSRMENGSLLASEAFADTCDRVFQTSGHFARLRRRVSRQGHPEWFIPYLLLEEQASKILDFSAYLVMGILQTAEYAEALYRASHPRDSDATITEKVKARLQRRGIFERPAPPLLWMVLDEGCLRRQVGGREVMRQQLDHLLVQAQNPNIVLQVLPFDSGAPAAGEPFTLLTSVDDASPPVLYTEMMGIGHVIDSAPVVGTSTEQYERLRADALSPEKTLWLLADAIREYSR